MIAVGLFSVIPSRVALHEPKDKVEAAQNNWLRICRSGNLSLAADTNGPPLLRAQHPIETHWEQACIGVCEGECAGGVKEIAFSAPVCALRWAGENVTIVSVKDWKKVREMRV